VHVHRVPSALWRPTVALTVSVLLASCAKPPSAKGNVDATPAVSGNPALGKQLFDYTCDACHYADSTVARAGPGFLGLYKRKVLVNGAAVTDTNVERFIRDGSHLMPGYRDKITPEQMRDLIAFLRSL
jgi:mono/diheme cytochrome c family protein